MNDKVQQLLAEITAYYDQREKALDAKSAEIGKQGEELRQYAERVANDEQVLQTAKTEFEQKKAALAQAEAEITAQAEATKAASKKKE